MPLIPFAQESEIGKIIVSGQPRQKDNKTPSQQTCQADDIIPSTWEA
jgi:hypothetical protein